MEKWSPSRLRRRSVEVSYVNGDDLDFEEPLPPSHKRVVKEIIVSPPPVVRKTVIIHQSQLNNGDVENWTELFMECEEDILSPCQIKANHEAKQAHELAMKKIQAAKEGRLSFNFKGEAVIHDRVITAAPPPAPTPPRAPVYRAPTTQMPTNTTAIQQTKYPGYVGRPAVNNTYTRSPLTQRNESGIISGTYGLGVKRSKDDEIQDLVTRYRESEKRREQQQIPPVSGNTVTVSHYYGKQDGSNSYKEAKGEFRFKCWYCNKMLYNNVKAMMHLQSHIDSEKQQNLDLSDLTQCKHCYKQFDTPFEMQTHIEKVHLSRSSQLVCRICENYYDTQYAFLQHMKNTHTSCEMPYICQLCEFRSSMYGDVVNHFKKSHDSSPNLLCLYCLRVFRIKFVNTGWGTTQNYYHHLVKHQSKSRSKKCSNCKLAFLSPQDLKGHLKKDHMPNIRGPNTNPVHQERGLVSANQGRGSSVKSLNAPAVMKNLDLSRLSIPSFIEGYKCFECKGPMSFGNHFKVHKECTMCRYATSCGSAYSNHMLSLHSGQTIFFSITKENPLPGRRYCLCGFSSSYGNKLANHMVLCRKRTCFVKETTEETAAEETKNPALGTGASILDALGLVKKQTAKRSSEEEQSSSPFEQETFVGITNLGMAHRDAAETAGYHGDSDDYVAEESEEEDDDIVEDDGDDDDYKPSRRFKKSANPPRRTSGSMLVKMNFKRKDNSASPAGRSGAITLLASKPVEKKENSIFTESLLIKKDLNISENSGSEKKIPENVDLENKISDPEIKNKIDALSIPKIQEKDFKTSEKFELKVSESETKMDDSHKIEDKVKPETEEKKIVSENSKIIEKEGEISIDEGTKDVPETMETEDSISKNEVAMETEDSESKLTNENSVDMTEDNEKSMEDSCVPLKNSEGKMETSEMQPLHKKADDDESPNQTDNVSSNNEVSEHASVELITESETEESNFDKTDENLDSSTVLSNKDPETKSAENFEADVKITETDDQKSKAEDVASEKDKVCGTDIPNSEPDDENSKPSEKEMASEESESQENTVKDTSTDLRSPAEETEISANDIPDQSETGVATKDNELSSKEVESFENSQKSELLGNEAKNITESLPADKELCESAEKVFYEKCLQSQKSENPEKTSPEVLKESNDLEKQDSRSNSSDISPEKAVELKESSQVEESTKCSDDREKVERSYDDSRSPRKDNDSRERSSHDSREERYKSSSSYDKHDRYHSNSSSRKDHHSNRYEREDKYRDRSSSRHDDYSHSSRDYNRHDNRSRDYGSHGNRDRDHHKDDQGRDYYKDDRYHDRGHRKDRDDRSYGSHSNRHGRSNEGYHGNHRRDYY